MALKVKNVVEELHKLDCKLIAGAGGLENDISVIDGMEIPDIAPWLVEGELITITGYALKDQPNGLLELVRNMYTVNGAAIVLKTRFLGKIPDNVIDEANRLNIPIIETPNKQKYGELKKIIYALLLNDQNLEYTYSEYVQNEFMKVLLAQGGFQQICAKIHELTTLPVNIIDSSNVALAKSPNNVSGICSDIHSLISTDEYYHFTHSSKNSQIFKMGNKYLHIYKVCANNVTMGYLTISCTKSDISKKEKAVIHHAINIIAMEYTKIQAVRKNIEIFNDNLFVDIIMGNIKNPQVLDYRAESLNWPKPPFSMILFNINNFNKYIKSRSELEIYQVKTRIQQIISSCIVYHNHCTATISKGDFFILLIDCCEHKQIQKLAEAIYDIVADSLQISMTAGCVTNISDYTSIAKTYKEAENVIAICRKKYPSNKIFFSDDVLLEQGLICNTNDYFLRYIQNTIGVLKEYDEKNKSDLLHILTTLVRNMGIRKKTAEELFMHRNTLTDKIKKIEGLLGMNLSENDIFLKLYIAIFIEELL